MYYIILFVIGCCLGSFAYCFSYDWVHQQVHLTRRSQCDHCQTSLGLLDLLPILSQLVSGFRCRYCKNRTSSFYIIVEFSSGLLLVWTTYLFPTMSLWFVMLFTLLVLLFVYCDIHAMFIPDILQVGLLIAMIYYTQSTHIDLMEQFILLACTLFTLLLITTIRPNSLGGADIKAITIISLCIPISLFPLFLFITSLSALVFIGIRYVLYRSIHDPIPFLPFIFIGLYFVLSI